MKAYVGTANTRPDSRTPRKFATVIKKTPRRQSSTRYG